MRNVICHLSLTRGSCTWHFLLSFHRVLLCGIARVSAHDCEIEFNSHTQLAADVARGGIHCLRGGGHNINITTIVIMFLSTHKIYRYISRRNWQTSPQCGIDNMELGHFLFCSLTQPKFKVSVIYGGNENEIPLPCSRQRFAPLLLGPDFPASPLFPRVTRNT